jgi:hypothetical protein
VRQGGRDRGSSFLRDQGTYWDREYPEKEEGNPETNPENLRLLKDYLSEIPIRNNSVSQKTNDPNKDSNN